MTSFAEIGFGVCLAGFLFTVFTTWSRIPRNISSFRGRFLLLSVFLSITIISLAYIAPKLFSISLEASYKISLICGVLGTVVLFLTYRYRYKAQFLPKDDFQTLAAVYFAQNLHVAYLISDLISNVSQIENAVYFPNHHQSLNTLVGILKKFILKNTNDVELLISILETRPNGQFKVVYTTDNIPLPVVKQMEINLFWDKPVKGVAGVCASTNNSVLCTDLTKDKLSAVRHWVNITGKQDGGILCVPIAYPQNFYDGDDGQVGKCFGVLCISASKTNFLQDYHREWIEVILVKGLANLLFIHRLHDRMYLE